MHNFVNSYFLRTYSQHEVDYVEEAEGKLKFFEFKYQVSKHTKLPRQIASDYPEAVFQVITSENVFKFLA